MIAQVTTGAWTRWTLDPSVLLIVLAGIAYELGRGRIRRDLSPGRVVTTTGVLCFWSGLVVLVIALVSPIDAIADDLFCVHMVQHLLLALIAPLLLLIGKPWRVMTRALDAPTRRRVLRTGHRLGTATGLSRSATVVGLAVVAFQVSTFVVWHLPIAYDLAVRDEWVHAMEHSWFFMSGLLLWWVVLGPRWEERSGVAILYLFLAALPMGALAALLTLAPHPLYLSHLHTTQAWGLTPLEDQQLGGAIMWVPGGIVYLTAACALFVRWLGSGPMPGEQRNLVWDA